MLYYQNRDLHSLYSVQILPKKGYKAKACFRLQEEINSETDVLVKECVETEKPHTPLFHKGGIWPAGLLLSVH